MVDQWWLNLSDDECKRICERAISSASLALNRAENRLEYLRSGGRSIYKISNERIAYNVLTFIKQDMEFFEDDGCEWMFAALDLENREILAIRERLVSRAKVLIRKYEEYLDESGVSISRLKDSSNSMRGVV